MSQRQIYARKHNWLHYKLHGIRNAINSWKDDGVKNNFLSHESHLILDEILEKLDQLKRTIVYDPPSY